MQEQPLTFPGMLERKILIGEFVTINGFSTCSIVVGKVTTSSKNNG